jgi:hypothetical protein
LCHHCEYLLYAVTANALLFLLGAFALHFRARALAYCITGFASSSSRNENRDRHGKDVRLVVGDLVHTAPQLQDILIHLSTTELVMNPMYMRCSNKGG